MTDDLRTRIAAVLLSKPMLVVFAFCAGNLFHHLPQGEERCETCDKWIEPGCYEIEDHFKTMQEDDWLRDESRYARE